MQGAFNPTKRCIKSLLLSPLPEGLYKFYEKKGLTFKEFFLSNEVHYISLNGNISIIKSDNQYDCIGGLISYNLNTKCCPTSYIYNNKKNLAYGETHVSETVYEEISHTTNHKWVSVIRNIDIEETREFYKHAGDWNKEQHGSGPVHYSLESNGSIFEIYPQKKDKAVIMEYIIEKSSSSLPRSQVEDTQVEDIQGRQVKFI